MNKLYAILRLVLLFVIASGFYLVGATNTSYLLIAIGVGFEIAFWLGLLEAVDPGSKKKPTS
jgi:hypothetical protein|tara:strand:- start:535 stop:720 length:186 start_codon:yes stop_codon:yes gene_type:complete